MYFAFLRRPLQAWEYINASSAKCLLLLSYPPENETEDDGERIRRIFWSCYILERSASFLSFSHVMTSTHTLSDYLAELHALPQSGISQTESSTPLPGAYDTHASAQKMELSSLYFLACISMRRLLNRVHHLLYARDSGTALNPARFPAVVRELDHQLEEWREVLPQAFAFSVGFNEVGAGRQATETEAGGFLRQRYLTCRSVIYRPYLMWMLSGMGPTTAAQSPGQSSVGREALRNCKMCLDACLLHILNLRGFGQTVLADTWICSLRYVDEFPSPLWETKSANTFSMAGAMLMLLAACRVTDLQALLGPEVLVAGEHLQTLLERWQAFMGNPRSPSVEQSMKLIADADRLIKQVYKSQEHGPAVEIAGVAPKQAY
jgi:transcription factor-like protein